MFSLKKLFKKTTNRGCITCSKFAWWDGDYCCLADFVIMQESPDGKFTKDIIPFIKASKYCKNYEKDNSSLYKDEYENFLKENDYENHRKG